MSVAEHILLATDFSEAADEAVDKAHELARTLAAKLTVIHVHGHPPASPEAYVDQERMISSADLDREAKEQLESLRNQRLSDLSVDLVSCENASAALAVCDYADQHDVDLIVIGSHGRTGISRLLIGSVAEKTARHATCPVLVVPHGKGQKAAKPH